MTDLTRITPDEIVTRLDSLSAPLMAVLRDESYTQKLDELVKKIGIAENNITETIREIFGYIILGIFPYEMVKLSEDIDQVFKFGDKEASEKLAQAMMDIAAPVAAEIKKNYKALPLPSVVAVKDMAKPTSSFVPPTTSASLPSGLTKAQGGTDKPFFIHTETTFSPVAKPKEEAKTGIGLGERIASIFKSSKPTGPATNTAKIGIGAPAPKPVKAEGSVKTEIAAPRIVHYGEMKTALGKVPTPIPTPASKPGEGPQKPAPVSLGAIGRPAPVPMHTPAKASVPAPAPHPTIPAAVPTPTPTKPATSWRIDDPARELPAAPTAKPETLPVTLPGIKGVPPPPTR
jgi:hypothetical protein